MEITIFAKSPARVYLYPREKSEKDDAVTAWAARKEGFRKTEDY